MTKKTSKAKDSERPSAVKGGEEPLRRLVDHSLFTVPNVWPQPPVSAQPRKLLSPWSVHQATPKNGQPNEMYGLHFVGRDLPTWLGCVSSRIMSFDPETMCGTTRSGRIYELVDLPGHCLDGDYVLGHWAHSNDVDVADVTEEFLKTYGLTREGINNASQKRRPRS